MAAVVAALVANVVRAVAVMATAGVVTIAVARTPKVTKAVKS